jgi:hypothetical protein
MSSQDNQGSQSDDALNLQLARKIRQLDIEMEPSRDLWPAIERSILDNPQANVKKTDWMPYGIAASILIAVSALITNVFMLNQQSIPVKVADNLAVDNLRVEYFKVKNSLKDQFIEKNSSLPTAALDDLYRNLEILEDARKEIEAQIRENPGDQRLVEMLMRVHAQEIDLLKQDYSRSGHFI